MFLIRSCEFVSVWKCEKYFHRWPPVKIKNKITLFSVSYSFLWVCERMKAWWHIKIRRKKTNLSLVPNQKMACPHKIFHTFTHRSRVKTKFSHVNFCSRVKIFSFVPNQITLFFHDFAHKHEYETIISHFHLWKRENLLFFHTFTRSQTHKNE